MYSTCLHCQRDLGTNESVEAFPVGRRVAFDAVKGRLWAICPHCQRWNLAPLDERWEAIEQCERLFRGTRIRSSTDQIGLARLREGTELVRIGEPLRPEFAAWRYSDAIVRRRKRNLIIAGAGILAATALGAGIVAAGVGAGFGNVLNLGAQAWRRRRDKRVVFRDVAAGEEQILRAGQLDRLVLRVPDDQAPFRLELQPEQARRQRGWDVVSRLPPVAAFEGASLMPVAGLALARYNRTAGRPQHIQEAVALLDRYGNPFTQGAHIAGWLERPRRQGLLLGRFLLRAREEVVPLKPLETPVRLALEMAAHEERERLFLASHLSVLEAAWKEAEEIARIADDLLIPEWIRDRIGR
jgi:hypothetical protein